MPTDREFDRKRLARAIGWTLRVTVVLQCLANWRWLTQLEETPLLHWMLDPADIGGLAWPETTSLAIQQFVGWALLAAAPLVLWRPRAIVLAPLAIVQLLIAVAMWRIAAGYPLQIDWVPPQLLMLFPFATELLRIGAPIGLLLLVNKKRQNDLGGQSIAIAMQLLRWATAVVFLAHGIEAMQANPRFVDLILSTSLRIFGVSLDENMATRCLTFIGVVDIGAAIACVSTRSIVVMNWMAFWGGVTALSRITAYGWAIGWHEALGRAPHLGVPVAVALGWYLLESKRATSASALDIRGASLGTQPGLKESTQ